MVRCGLPGKALAKRKAGTSKRVVRRKTLKHAGEAKSSPSTCQKPTGRGDQIRGEVFTDITVAWALADCLRLDFEAVYQKMLDWQKPILKVPLPGRNGALITARALAMAQRKVLRFLNQEEALGPRSHVFQAFYLVTGEPELHFAWDDARQRTRRARLDHRRGKPWDWYLAMNIGNRVSDMQIHICATRPVTLKALTSLLCHEALHNLARRRRRGNPFLSEDLEHIAMALLGDPQLRG